MNHSETKRVPKMIMLVGMPASGKSTVAEHLFMDDAGDILLSVYPHPDRAPIIHSSDALREEMFGDINHQSDNDDLFKELHRRIKADLIAGKDVIYDATNISKKFRIAFLNELRRIPCCKVCIAMMTPYEQCITNNSMRDRVVPERVIRRAYMNWQPPHFHEGFDDVRFVFLEADHSFTMNRALNIMDAFDQENSHHTLTLGGHCRKAAKYCQGLQPQNRNLAIAALLHDIGKMFTKVRVNSRGIEDGDCHYYQHHCVGAYLATFCMTPPEFSINDQCDIINMIYYHMHPYMAWKQSEKALNRDRALLGDKLFNEIMLLHEADLNAH